MYTVCIYIITRISFKTCVALYHDKNNVPARVFAHYAELAWCLSAFVPFHYISLAYKTCLACSTKRWIFETMITRATCDKQIGYSRKFPTFLFFTSTETFACLVVWHTLTSSSGRKRKQSQHTRPALNPSLRVATPSVASSSGHKCSER